MNNRGFSDSLITGTVIGYRWWDLWLPGFPRPASLFHSLYFSLPLRPFVSGAWAPWLPGDNHAICLRSFPEINYQVREPHSSPGITCNCGFWAFWNRPPYWRTAPGVNLDAGLEEAGVMPVLGVAEGWGRTFRGSLGFRCEYAKITALLAPPAYKGLLSELQPQAMIYTTPAALFAEHPSGLTGNNAE